MIITIIGLTGRNILDEAENGTSRTEKSEEN